MNMVIKKWYTTILCGALISAPGNFCAQEAKELDHDEYQVYIEKTTNAPQELFYTFAKTKVTGIIPTTENSIQSFSGFKLWTEVDLTNFPMLKREKQKLSTRATQYTKLFVSADKEALKAVTVNNNATRDQKKLVASGRVPQALGTYCIGNITFVVDGPAEKLTVKPKDNLNCMRSGSKSAQATRSHIKREKKLRASMKSEVELAQQEAADAQTKFQEAQKALQQAKAEAQAAQAAVEQAKKEAVQAAGSAAEKEKAQADLETTQEELRVAKKELVNAQRLVQASGRELKREQGKAAELEKQLKAEKEEHVEAQVKVAEQQKRIAELEALPKKGKKSTKTP